VLRCYIIATGIAFALIFFAHVARLFAEGAWLLHEPMFVLTSILSLGLAVWAAILMITRRG